MDRAYKFVYTCENARVEITLLGLGWLEKLAWRYLARRTGEAECAIDLPVSAIGRPTE